MLLLAVASVVLTVLVVASLADVRTGEVPEALSMGLLAFMLLVSAATSLFDGNPAHLLETVGWGAVAFLGSYAIFYLGQWGGGDVKISSGIGCFLGYMGSLGYAWPNGAFAGYPIPALATYAVNMAVLSTPYVIIYTLWLGLRNPAVFRDYAKKVASAKTLLLLAVSLSPLMAAYYLGLWVMAFIYSFIPLLVLASIYLKTVEDSVLTKTVKVSQLKDWDILADDVVADGVKVAPRGVIEGISPEQLARVRELAALGKIPDTIRTKWGVVYLPVLSAALPVTVCAGNLLEILFNRLFTQ
jgi:hypothetical protein